MTRTVARIVARMIPVLFLVTIATAVLTEFLPGDPAVAILGPEATPEQYAQVRESLGLDDSAVARYFDWLGSMAMGDFGRTLVPPIQDVSDLVLSRLPITLAIAFLAVLLSLAISIPLGIWSAYRYEKFFDRTTSALSFGFISMPSFLLALIAIYLFVFRPETVKIAIVVAGAAFAAALAGGAIGPRSRSLSGQQRKIRFLTAAAVLVVSLALSWFLPQFPRQGFTSIADGGLLENLRSIFLPVFVLAVIESAQLTRLLRGDMVATLNEDFVLASRAQGMPV